MRSCITRPGPRPRPSVLFGAAALVLSSGSADALSVIGMTGADGIRPGQPIVLRLDREPTPADGALAVFIGRTDVSSLFGIAANELTFTGKDFALSPGELPIVVWQVRGGQWQEIHRGALTILAASQADEASGRKGFVPTLDLTVKSQVHERRRGAATRPVRPTFSDLALRAGLGIDRQVGPVAARGNVNLVGSSFREEALQFAGRGVHAAKVDLADYRFDLGHGPGQLSIGHIGWGNHPLLLNSYGSRGLAGTVKLGHRFDVSVNAMNGTSIVGFDNLLGLNESQHRIYGASVGIEADPAQAGWLRGELSYVDASLQARNNFNRGEIPDAEQSRGFGVRLLSRMFDGRLRSDIALARNEYRPADDPQLALGQSLTLLQASTRSARIFDVAFDLVRGWAIADGWPLTLTPVLRYERIAPLYKVLGASISADQRVHRVGLSGQIGAVQANWSRSRREDNLDDIVSLLKTRTEGEELAVSVALAEIFRVAAPAPTLWPRLAFQWQSNRQFAVNAPPFELSGLLPTHRPDQQNRTAALALGWTLGRYSVNYGINQAHQDNRQPGRERADFRNLSHQLSVSVAWSEALSVNAAADRTRQYSYEKQLASYTRGASFGFDWRLADHWTVGGSYSLTRGDDSRDIAESRGNTVHTQLGRRFTLPGLFGAPMSGQWFVRHALQGAGSRDRAFGLQSGGRNWAVSVGASLSMF